MRELKAMRAALAATVVLLVGTQAIPAQPLASAAAAPHLGKAVRLMQQRQFSEAAAEI